MQASFQCEHRSQYPGLLVESALVHGSPPDSLLTSLCCGALPHHPSKVWVKPPPQEGTPESSSISSVGGRLLGVSWFAAHIRRCVGLVPAGCLFPFLLIILFSTGMARCLWQYQQRPEPLPQPRFQRDVGAQHGHTRAQQSPRTARTGHLYFGGRMAFCCFATQRKLLALIMFPCRKLWPVILFSFFFLALFFIKWS